MEAKITPRGREPARISWNTTQPAVITLDHRLGRIKGRLKPTDARGFTGQMRVYVRLDGPRGRSAPGPVSLRFNSGMEASQDGSFQFDGVPPGRYVVDASSEKDASFIAKAVGGVEVAPNGVATVEVPLERLVTITGRVIDAQTGKGVPNIPVACYHIDHLYRKEMRSGRTDAEGRYSVLAQPGTVHIEAQGLPKSYLGPIPEEYPNLEVKADRTVPDLKLTHAIGLDGIVVDRSGPSGSVGRGLLPVHTRAPDGPVARSRCGRDPTGRSTSTSSTPTTRRGSGPEPAMRRRTVPSWPGRGRARSRSRSTRSTPSGSAAW